MKRMSRVLLCAVVALLAAMPARAQQQPQAQVVGAWTNQSGSTLYIDSVAPGGMVTGRYINRAAGFACQNTAYPVTGWLNGTAITFSVIWTNSTQSCNSVTGWTGSFDLSFTTLSTNWVIARNGSRELTTGQSVFTRTAPPQPRPASPS
jgi:hypothetical protein